MAHPAAHNPGCPDSRKPCHLLAVCAGAETWFAYVYRNGVLMTQGRGRTEHHAVQAAVSHERERMRLERAGRGVRGYAPVTPARWW